MLPNVIIIGAMKAGTTSLHHYLSLHPEIQMSREKELNFFITERNWEKGVEWYASHFVNNATVRGESSPNYTAHPRFLDVPARMHAVVPDAKLIYVLRDPIERMVSHYVHAYAERTEERPPEKALADLDSVYVARSKYHMQMEQYLRWYPTSRILLVTAEELYGHRGETLRTVFRFLGVNDAFHSQGFLEIRHRSNVKRRKSATGAVIARAGGAALLARLPAEFRWHAGNALYRPFSRRVERPILSPSLRARLGDVLAGDIGRLRESTGCSFAGWSI